MKSKLLPSKAELAAAKRAGRHGDTELIHANKREEAILAAMGGAGTRNPRTGLLEFYSDSANEHSRAETGHNMADHSRPGASGGGSGGAGRSGGSQLAGNATVADHMIATGRISVPSIGPNGMATGPNQTQDDAYTEFGSALGAEDTKGLAARVLDFFSPLGVHNMQVDSQKPATFKNGTFQPGINPAHLVGSIGGMFLGPAGIVAGPLLGAGYTALGGQDIPLGGFDGSGAPHTQAPGKITEGDTRLLPQIAGNPSPTTTTPTPTTSPTGATLPPITAPVQNVNPGATMPIPGPSQYSWLRPAWTY
jgi:hypothetical protein